MIPAAGLTIVLVHGGGWLLYGPPAMDRYRPALPKGAQVVNVAYTEGNYRQGLSDVRAAVKSEQRRGQRVLVVGVSAGGGYAAAVAAHGDAPAVAVAPVLDYR